MLDYDHTLDETDGPASTAERRVAAQRIAAEVNALPSAQRACVIYRWYDGCDLAATAALMGKPVGAVKQLQHRAMRRLRSRLAEDAELLVGVTRDGTPVPIPPVSHTITRRQHAAPTGRS